MILNLSSFTLCLVTLTDGGKNLLTLQMLLDNQMDGFESTRME